MARLGYRLTFPSYRKELARSLKRFYPLYFLFLPVFAFLILFKYVPIVNQFVLALKDYRYIDGIWGSPWAGLTHFEKVFSSRDFPIIVRNTLAISLLRLFWGFAPPILLAIFLNDLRSTLYRRVSQTIVYLPHFLSWVIVYGIAYVFISPGFGLINTWLNALGLPSVDLVTSSEWFRTIIVSTGLWRELGWSTIIYLAALSGVDPELYKAASIDGANVFRRLWHVTLPGIRPIIVFVLILNMGSIMTTGFEQIFLFQTSANYDVSDVIETWVYRRGLIDLDFSLATAVGIFQAVIGLFTILAANFLARKYTGTGIW